LPICAAELTAASRPTTTVRHKHAWLDGAKSGIRTAWRVFLIWNQLSEVDAMANRYREFSPVRDFIEPFTHFIAKCVVLGDDYISNWNEFTEWLKPLPAARLSPHFMPTVNWIEVHHGKDRAASFRRRIEDAERAAGDHLDKHEAIVINDEGLLRWRGTNEDSIDRCVYIGDELVLQKKVTRDMEVQQLHRDWRRRCCMFLSMARFQPDNSDSVAR
jgi:hypothetical protein